MQRTIVGALLAALIAGMGWTASAAMSHAERLSSVEARLSLMEVWLNRVEGKLDRTLERK